MDDGDKVPHRDKPDEDGRLVREWEVETNFQISLEVYHSNIGFKDIPLTSESVIEPPYGKAEFKIPHRGTAALQCMIDTPNYPYHPLYLIFSADGLWHVQYPKEEREIKPTFSSISEAREHHWRRTDVFEARRKQGVREWLKNLQTGDDDE